MTWKSKKRGLVGCSLRAVIPHSWPQFLPLSVVKGAFPAGLCFVRFPWQEALNMAAVNVSLFTFPQFFQTLSLDYLKYLIIIRKDLISNLIYMFGKCLYSIRLSWMPTKSLIPSFLYFYEIVREHSQPLLAVCYHCCYLFLEHKFQERK